MHHYFFFIILAILCFFSTPAFSARFAEVAVPRAIVYGDPELKTPIGFIRKGKKVKIGDKKRRKGQVIAAIISGRLTYLEVSDLFIKGEKNLKYSRGNRLSFERGKDDYFKNNFLIFTVEMLSAGEQWDEYSQVDDDSPESLLSFRPGINHRSPYKKYYFGMGLARQTIEQEKNTYNSFVLDVTASYISYKNDLFSLDLSLGLLFAPIVKITNVDLTEESKGYGYGYHISAQTTFFPSQKIGLIIGVSYKALSLTDLLNVQLAEQEEGKLIIGGIGYFAGLQYKFN